jgi:hypothetical protein
LPQLVVQRHLNRSALNSPNACRIENIAQNDAMILTYNANRNQTEFSEETGVPMVFENTAFAL